MSGTVEFEPRDEASRAWLKALVARANGGDRDALEELRSFLDETPELWQKVGDLAAHAEASWLEVITGADALVAESVRREADRLREELLGPRPTPVERLLVAQVVVCHLELEHNLLRTSGAPGVSETQVTARLKRIESAQRRYLAAIRALEQVRRLAGTPAAETRLRVFGTEDGRAPKAATSKRTGGRAK